MSAKMLVPLDGSELAEAVLPYVEAIGRALGWSAVLLHVVEPEPVRHPPADALGGAIAHYEIEPGLEREARLRVQAEEAAAYDALAAPAARLEAAGVPAEREVAVGNPRDVIAGRAQAPDIALIAMASHGRTGLARLLRGSVAAGVAEAAPRPTLVVRPFRDEQARVDLEHAERLPREHVEAIRRAVEPLTRS
ncbi:MAG TPA: universal stress protein [Chloroflexota bacterium]|jgi:nucleotide-binding universal stress UspA family protein|nr:universal stress protein [Chloroflexota bacterium]